MSPKAATEAFGLIASSAILVHLSGGYIELHFHFFVMVGLLALYQEWVPFLLAIAFVLLDLDRRVTFVNEAAVKLFGWDRRRVVGERFQALSLASGEPEDFGATARTRTETFRKPDGSEAVVEYVRTAIVTRG